MGDFTTQYSRLIIHSTAFQKGRHQTPELEQACLAKVRGCFLACGAGLMLPTVSPICIPRARDSYE